MDVHVYTVEAKNRADTPYPHSEFHTQNYDEALAYAEQARLMLIDNTYTFEDSELVKDFTPGGEDDPGA